MEKKFNGAILYDRAFFGSQKEAVLRSARAVVPLIVDLLRPQRVIDVGCGLGAWLLALSELGVPRVHGIDGDYLDRSTLLIPPSEFSALDLSRPFSMTERFDLAISLEVAEHLPPRCAAGFVESLVQLAPFVLFSAAIPLQGGVNHCNEQWPHYWETLFLRHGFVQLDLIRHRIWHDSRVAWWYKQNMFLYASREQITAGRIHGLPAEEKAGPRMTLICEQVLEAHLQSQNSLRQTLRRLPGLCVGGLGRRLWNWHK